MIIRLGKFEATIFCALIVLFSFIGAVKYESSTTPAVMHTQSVSLPVIMYHHMTETKSKTGKYTVLTHEFESDLEFLKDKGYKTVTVSDLIDFVEHGKALPEKPVMLTFDDGFESFYTLAFPLLKRNNEKAVVSVIGSVTEKYSEIDDHNINYSNLTFKEITELSESGYAEIQNHSYNMHNNASGKRKGMSKMKNESENDYALALKNDLEKMQKILRDNCNIEPTAVVFPYGAYSKESLNIVKSCGFKCTMLCEERVNTITRGNAECLYGLGRYNRESGISSEEFFKDILEF